MRLQLVGAKNSTIGLTKTDFGGLYIVPGIQLKKTFVREPTERGIYSSSENCCQSCQSVQLTDSPILPMLLPIVRASLVPGTIYSLPNSGSWHPLLKPFVSYTRGVLKLMLNLFSKTEHCYLISWLMLLSPFSIFSSYRPGLSSTKTIVLNVLRRW